GIATRLIAVVNEHNLGSESLESADMLFRERGTQRRDGISHPRLMQRNAVCVAFGDDYMSRLPNPLAGMIRSANKTALVKDDALRAVPVLAMTVISPGDNPPAKRDRLATLITGRKQQTIDEIVVMAVIPTADQPGCFQHFRRELPAGLPDQPIPIVGVIADA